MGDLNEAARGRWPDILASLAGLTDQQLTDRHQPCPLCGGEDRYRFDDQDGSGSWFCNQCGGKHQAGGAGNGMDLLMRKTGWEFKRAAEEVERHLGIARPTPKAKGKPARVPNQPPANAAPPSLAGASAQWCYTDATGAQLFWIQRVNLSSGGKLFLHRTWIDGAWHRPSKADAFTSEWPAPRPPYGLHLLAQAPDAGVLIVEGEKTAEAARLLFFRTVVLTWCGGAGGVLSTDWSALAGRRVALWPDNDTPGLRTMAKLAQHLLQLGKAPQQLRIVAPPADAPAKWDLADATWSPQEAAEHVKSNLLDDVQGFIDANLPQAVEQPTLPTPTPEQPPIEIVGNAHFECLGFDGDVYYYQPRNTGQVVRLAAGSHSSTNMVRLAPLPYWETLYPGPRGTNWTAAAASLFQQCAAAGVYSPDRLRGRGAYIDGRHVVLHLGDRLVIDGHESSILKKLPFKSRYVYQRAQLLDGPGTLPPLTDDEALPLLELAERFRWEVPASGLLLAGWVTLAPVCGALDWRPHAWLTGGAGTGKSAILERYVMPLLGDLMLPVASNTTEAGLRQTLRSDAMPVVFDEAESNEKVDHARMQAILGLARVASTETRAHLIKGSPSGEVSRFHIRSMFFLSSIATSLKQGADRSRFAQLTLRSTADQAQGERQDHWEALDRDLERYVTPEVAQRLISRTVSLIPTIRASTRVFSRAAAEHFDSQRLGDQYGALLAGAWSLMSTAVVTDREARALIEQNDWAPYSQSTEVPDELRCIEHILQTQVRVDITTGPDRVSTATRTLGELVDHLAMPDNSHHLDAEGVLGRHGIKVDGQGTGAAVVISNTAKALAAILADTAWAHSWATVLARLPGAEKVTPQRFKGITGTSRAIRLRYDQLQA